MAARISPRGVGDDQSCSPVYFFRVELWMLHGESGTRLIPIRDLSGVTAVGLHHMQLVAIRQSGCCLFKPSHNGLPCDMPDTQAMVQP